MMLLLAWEEQHTATAVPCVLAAALVLDEKKQQTADHDNPWVENLQLVETEL